MNCVTASQPVRLRVDRGSPRAATVAAAAAGLATFLAYLPGIGRSLDFDSAQTVGDFVRRGPPWSVFGQQEIFNNHPMFSFLEQLVRVVTGRTDAATMRFLPILFGALTVGVLVWYCARRFGVVAGVAAGVVVAANPTFYGLSRAARGYSLLALCALLSTIVLLDEIESPSLTATRTRSRSRDVIYVLAAVCGLATHLFMGVVLAVHVTVVVGTRRLDARWRERFLATAALGGVAYLGMIAQIFGANAEHARVFQLGLPWDITQVARIRGVSNAQIALAWVAQQPGITAPVFGASQPRHLDDAVAALEIKLEPSELKMLEPYQPHRASEFRALA